MIYISSKAGQRLAKAQVQLEKATALYNQALSRTEDPAARLRAPKDSPESDALNVALQEWHDASKAIGKELIADRHHEAEGD